jgi:ABC-type uncharacterized transport system permease subunit
MAHAMATLGQPLTRNFARLPGPLREILRWTGWIGLALVIYTALLLAYRRDPVQAYSNILTSTLGTRFGISEVLVKVVPLVLCGLAVAIPARVGLVNVGAEG